MFIYPRFFMSILHFNNTEKMNYEFWDTPFRAALAITLSLLITDTWLGFLQNPA